MAHTDRFLPWWGTWLGVYVIGVMTITPICLGIGAVLGGGDPFGAALAGFVFAGMLAVFLGIPTAILLPVALLAFEWRGARAFRLVAVPVLALPMLALAAFLSPLLSLFAVPIARQIAYALLVAPPAVPRADDTRGPGLMWAGNA